MCGGGVGASAAADSPQISGSALALAFHSCILGGASPGGYNGEREGGELQGGGDAGEGGVGEGEGGGERSAAKASFTPLHMP